MVDAILDTQSGVKASDIIGWVVWDDTGTRFSSLGTLTDDLPVSGIQVVLLYYFNPTGKRFPDGRKFLRRVSQTGFDRYKVPRNDGTVRFIRGDWTTMPNHQRICDQAFQEWWPRS